MRQASRQICCWCVCKMLERLEKSKPEYHDFEPLRNHAVRLSVRLANRCPGHLPRNTDIVCGSQHHVSNKWWTQYQLWRARCFKTYRRPFCVTKSFVSPIADEKDCKSCRYAVCSKNIARHTTHISVSWPCPKPWLSIYIADLMMIVR